MRKIALLISYHGSGFYGFQRQPGFTTVQEELEQAWLAVAGEQVVMHGSGRTDTGVHAYGQVVHFSTLSSIPEHKIRMALNAYLPDEMAVRNSVQAADDFHARFHAIGKRYLYRMKVSSIRPVLEAGNVGWLKHPAGLDLPAMRAGAQHLLGTHDFSAFAAARRGTLSSERTLQSIRIWEIREGFSLMVQGNGFLYKMVRNLVGSLVEVGQGRRAPEWIASVLESLDRTKAGPTAPAEGLTLWKVLYPMNSCPGLSQPAKSSYPRS